MDSGITPVYVADELPGLPYWVDRREFSGDRHYIAHWDDPDVGIEAYISSTTVLQKFRETPRRLVEWMIDNHGSTSHYQHHLLEKADNGSIIHAMIADVTIMEIPTHDYDRFLDYACEKGRRYGRSREWVEERLEGMYKAIMSFLAFCRDYEVEILAVEIPLVSRYYQVGNQLDLVLRMNAKKYTEATLRVNRHRITAIVDFKTGNVYPSHADQLMINKLTWNETYPGYKINKLYNLRPTDWQEKIDRKTGMVEPKYELRDQTDQASELKILAVLHLWKIVNERDEDKLKYLLRRERQRHKELRSWEDKHGVQMTHLPRRLEYTEAVTLGKSPSHGIRLISGLDHYMKERARKQRLREQEPQGIAEGEIVKEEGLYGEYEWKYSGGIWYFKNTKGEYEPGGHNDQQRLNAAYNLSE